VVPRTLWARLMPPDDENRILLATNCLLLRAEIAGQRHVVLVDAGNGDKWDDVLRGRYSIEGPGVLEASLAREGGRPEDVTMLLLTHLHFDHAGGGTRLDPQGRPVPTFPRARVLVQRQDLDDAKHPHLRVRASYLSQDWECLEAAGMVEPLDGDQEVLPGLWVRLAPGHIQGLQMVVVEGGGRKVVYPSDLIATSHHVQPAWAMGYDLDVVRTVDERIRLLDEITNTETVVIFEHDPLVPAGTVSRDGKGKYVVTPVGI
jgi:glyoxylase-like metal-dependent hydrolase (beta-lactamase superfamily II)